MIPYFQLGTIPLGHHFRLSLFGILLMTAILVARGRILHLERAEGRSDERIALLCLVMLVFGLICAHVAKIVLADIPAFLAHPAIVLQNLSWRRSSPLPAPFLERRLGHSLTERAHIAPALLTSAPSAPGGRPGDCRGITASTLQISPLTEVQR